MLSQSLAMILQDHSYCWAATMVPYIILVSSRISSLTLRINFTMQSYGLFRTGVPNPLSMGWYWSMVHWELVHARGKRAHNLRMSGTVAHEKHHPSTLPTVTTAAAGLWSQRVWGPLIYGSFTFIS